MQTCSPLASLVGRADLRGRVDLLRLPVTVVGGHLGAGKTTLINHLLRIANVLLAVLANNAAVIRAKGLVETANGVALLHVVGDGFELEPAHEHIANGVVCIGLKGVMTTEMIRRHATSQRNEQETPQAPFGPRRRRRPHQGQVCLFILGGVGAVEKTRTSTPVKEQRPQRCASTNSATTAHVWLRPPLLSEGAFGCEEAFVVSSEFFRPKHQSAFDRRSGFIGLVSCCRYQIPEGWVVQPFPEQRPYPSQRPLAGSGRFVQGRQAQIQLFVPTGSR